MLRSVICALGATLVLGCGETSIRSQEGHACSTNSSDDPQLVCSPALDLVCITTYSKTITNPQEAMKFDGGIRQVYVCRWACNTTSECPQSGDICCRGTIYGKTYNKMGGCVPPGSCDYEEPEPDGGVKLDSAPAKDTGVTGGADAGADAPAPMADAPAATGDAPAAMADAATGS